MAGISTGSHPFFRLSPAQLGKAQCFAVKRGEVDGLSFSPSRYAPEIRLFLNSLGSNPEAINPLSTYVDVNPSADVSELDADALVGFIPMQAVSDSIVGEYTITNRPLKEVRKGYSPFINGDILWAKITPCMQNGKSCIVDGLPNGVGFGSTEFHVIRVRVPGILPKFVFEFISQDTLRRVATYAFTGSAGQQRVPANFLENLPFPKFSETRQKELVAVMDEARVERKAKLKKANSLQAGLDDFVMETLGIRPPSQPKNTFAIQAKDLTNVMNAERYRGLQLEKNLPFEDTVGIVGSLLKKKYSPAKDAPEEQFDLIRIDDLPNQPWQVETVRTEKGKNITGTFFEVQENDILIARLGPTILNAKFVLCPKQERRTIASAEFLVLRCNQRHRSEAILWLLRTDLYRKIMYQLSRGATPSRFRLDGDDLLQIPFPQIDTSTQSIIATEVRRRREESRRLRSEAESGWQDAKRWFEEQLLGSPSR